MEANDFWVRMNGACCPPHHRFASRLNVGRRKKVAGRLFVTGGDVESAFVRHANVTSQVMSLGRLPLRPALPFVIGKRGEREAALGRAERREGRPKQDLTFIAIIFHHDLPQLMCQIP